MSCPLGDLLPCCVPRAEHWLTLLPPFSMCVYCFGVPPGQLPIVYSTAQPCWASLCREQSIAVLHVVWFCTCPLSSNAADVVCKRKPPTKKKKKKKKAPLALTDWQVAQARLQDYHTDRATAAATRAGILWQQYGEQSTFYFYHLAKQRQRSSALTSLQDNSQANALVDLSSPEGRVQGGQILAHHFSSASPQGLFAVRETSAEAQTAILASLDSRLTTDLTAVCDSPLTLRDLSEALSKLPRGKHPGSDGLPYEFYQAFWPLLGPPLLAVFLEAFASAAGSLTPTQLLGTVVLLYKGTGPRSDPASYRPITLLNADAKLLGKVLADRWGAPLSSVVDTTQTAFLPDRWIGDNILAHLEEVDYLESTQEPGCLVFLDFSKAYDRLDRNWVHRCMAALGFGPAARRWVSLLHDGLQCRVRYNGWLSPCFPVSSGRGDGPAAAPAPAAAQHATG